MPKARHCPIAEEEALRQVFYGKDSPGNLPAELIRSTITYRRSCGSDRSAQQITRP